MLPKLLHWSTTFYFHHFHREFVSLMLLSRQVLFKNRYITQPWCQNTVFSPSVGALSAVLYCVFLSFQIDKAKLWPSTLKLARCQINFAGSGFGLLRTYTHAHLLLYIRHCVPGLLIRIDQVQPSHFNGWQTSKAKLRKTSVCSQNAQQWVPRLSVLLQLTPLCVRLWNYHDSI